jgi:hypothetical protein
MNNEIETIPAGLPEIKVPGRETNPLLQRHADRQGEAVRGSPAPVYPVLPQSAVPIVGRAPVPQK